MASPRRTHPIEDSESPDYSPLSTHSNLLSRLASPQPSTSQAGPAARKRRLSATCSKSDNKRTKVAARVKFDADGNDMGEHLRLSKCKAIHYIDNNFTGRGLSLAQGKSPGAELCQALWEAHPEMLTTNGKPRALKGIYNLLYGIPRESCKKNTSWKDFCTDPKKYLLDDVKVRYDEYRASIEQSSATEETLIVNPELSLAPRHQSDVQNSNTARADQLDTLTSRTLQNPDPLEGAPSESWSSDYLKSATTTLQRPRLTVKQPQQVPLSNVLQVLSISSLPPQAKSLTPERPTQRTSCTQHDLRLSKSRSTSSEHAILQRRFACTSCEYETPWLGRAEVGRMNAAFEEDFVFQRSSTATPPKRASAASFSNSTTVRVKRTTVIPLPDATRYHLDTGSISRSLQDMFARTKSSIHQAFKDRRIEDGQAARFVTYANADIQHLYKVIVGDVDPSGNKDTIFSTALAEDLGISLFGAFLFRNVFDGSTEETFDKFVSKSDFAAKEIDQVLQELRSNSDTVLRNAYFRRLQDDAWVQKTFVHVADQLSEDFALRFEEHLGFQHGAIPKQDGPSVYKLSKRFSQIIMDALVLKCKISSAREKYEFLWRVGGDEMEPYTMEATQVNVHRVLLTTFPGLLTRGDGPHPKVLFRAQVELG